MTAPTPAQIWAHKVNNKAVSDLLYDAYTMIDNVENSIGPLQESVASIKSTVQGFADTEGKVEALAEQVEAIATQVQEIHAAVVTPPEG